MSGTWINQKGCINEQKENIYHCVDCSLYFPFLSFFFLYFEYRLSKTSRCDCLSVSVCRSVFVMSAILNKIVHYFECCRCKVVWYQRLSASSIQPSEKGLCKPSNWACRKWQKKEKWLGYDRMLAVWWVKWTEGPVHALCSIYTLSTQGRRRATKILTQVQQSKWQPLSELHGFALLLKPGNKHIINV